MLVPGQTLMSQVRGRGHLYPAQRMLLFLAQESDFSLLPTAVSCDAVLLSALFPGSMPAPHLALHSMRAPVFSDLQSPSLLVPGNGAQHMAELELHLEVKKAKSGTRCAAVVREMGPYVSIQEEGRVRCVLTMHQGTLSTPRISWACTGEAWTGHKELPLRFSLLLPVDLSQAAVESEPVTLWKHCPCRQTPTQNMMVAPGKMERVLASPRSAPLPQLCARRPLTAHWSASAL